MKNKHQCSNDDLELKTRFENCELPAGDFSHTAHIRMAYIYLVAHDSVTACEKMRTSLLHFLAHHGVDPKKYHQTLTRAWMLAVDHFMHKAAACTSSTDFIENSPALLDTRIMMSHYSEKALFSETARQHFVEPDLDPIPVYP